jgi:hypothetical protein
MFYWYRYCLRIYNRFKYVDEMGRWSATDRLDDGEKGRSTSRESRYSAGKSGRRKSRSLFPRIFSQRKKSFSSQHPQDDRDRRSTSRHHSSTSGAGEVLAGHGAFSHSQNEYSAAGYSQQAPGPVYAGYISLTVAGIFGDKQVRYYMLLEDGNLRWYESREAAETEPQQSVNARPVQIEYYEISTTNTAKDVYGIRLTPEAGHGLKKVFHFNCDTHDDLQGWVNAFQAAMHPIALARSAEQRSGYLRTPSLTGGTEYRKPGSAVKNQAQSGQHEYFTSNQSEIMGGTSDAESDSLLRRNNSHTPFGSTSKL